MSQDEVGGNCPSETQLSLSFRKLTADFLKEVHRLGYEQELVESELRVGWGGERCSRHRGQPSQQL